MPLAGLLGAVGQRMQERKLELIGEAAGERDGRGQPPQSGSHVGGREMRVRSS